MGKQLCQATFEKLENGDMDLVIRVPWESSTLTNTLRNCNREKNSVTLIQGDIVGDIGNRGNAASLHCDIDGHYVELKGGVNIYITRPASAGKVAAGYSKADAKEMERALDADLVNWTTLRSALMAPNGSVHAEAGDRIRRETLSDLIIAGFKLLETPPATPEQKHAVLTNKQHNANVNAAIDSKAKELGIAHEAVFAKSAK